MHGVHVQTFAYGEALCKFVKACSLAFSRNLISVGCSTQTASCTSRPTRWRAAISMAVVHECECPPALLLISYTSHFPVLCMV